MTTTPEALRLADAFDRDGYACFTNDMRAAAAELRRQHAEIDRLTRELAEARAEAEALRADAERWRWLRSEDSEVEGCALIYAGQALDAAIDNARQGKGE